MTEKGLPPPRLTILSSDPDVVALGGMIKGIAHFNARGLTLRHLKILIAAEYLIRTTKGKRYPNAKSIGQVVQLHPEQFEGELNDLLVARYLHEMMPTYGPLVMTYKLGSMGGTLMRQMMPKDAFSAFAKDAFASND